MNLSATRLKDVAAVSAFAAGFAGKPLRDVQRRLRELRVDWESRMRADWERWRAERTRSAIDMDWDVPADTISRAEMHELFAMIREVSARLLGLRHYDVQIAAGAALADSKIIDMKTGEGKTIVILLPAVYHGLLAQLAWEVTAQSKPAIPRPSVHVMTANDYLARRDAHDLRRVYEAFGLSVDAISDDENPLAKCLAYQCDIVYGTVNAFGFDYLRDKSAVRLGDRRQSRRHVAILDEVDHILIDEGTTPLVLSASEPDPAEYRRRTVHLFHGMRQLYETPQVFGVGADGVLSFSELGAAAITLAADQFLAEEHDVDTDEEVDGAINEDFLMAARICLQLADAASGQLPGGDENLLEWSGGRIRLREESARALRKSLSLLPSSGLRGAGEGFKQFVSAYRDIMADREFVIQAAGLTVEELDALRKLARPMLRGLLSGAIADAVVGVIDEALNDLLVTIAPDNGRSFLAHVGILLRLALDGNVAPIRNEEWAEVRARINLIAQDGALNQALWSLAPDLELFWIKPLTRVMVGLLKQYPPEYQVAYQSALRVLLAVFSSEHLDPTMSRHLSTFFNSIQGLLFVPTFYIAFPTSREIVLQPLGRVLLREFLRKALDMDVWPGRAPLPGESLRSAIDRLLPEAESICRVCLSAYEFQRRGVNYIVDKGEVKLISQYTGVMQEGRRYSGLLHLFLEAKEGIEIRESRQTIGRISVQHFVRGYRRMIGLSATAASSEHEFEETYGVSVEEIPPNCHELHVLANWKIRKDDPIGPPVALDGDGKEVRTDAVHVYLAGDSDVQRAFQLFGTAATQKTRVMAFAKDAAYIEHLRRMLGQAFGSIRLHAAVCPNAVGLSDRVYRTQREKYAEAARLVQLIHQTGQPILVAAPSIDVADKFRDVLQKAAPQIVATRLDARPEFAEREAEVIARAGEAGRVTIATQMVGRGVDIIVRRAEVERGGLHVVGLERRDSRRWDLQVAGRTARQGDLGFSTFFLSLEDELMAQFGSGRIAALMERLGAAEGEVLTHRLIDRSVRGAQQRCEESNLRTRTLTARNDDQLAVLRADIHELRDATLSSTHACPGVHVFGETPDVSIGDASILCARCTQQMNNRGLQPSSTLAFRAHTRQVIAQAFDQCLAGGHLAAHLVEQYAPEHSSVSDWRWTNLIDELSRFLGRKVEKDELCRAPSMSERLTRNRNRRVYIPDAAYRVLSKRIPAHAGRLVNPDNRETPWVERDMLEDRIAALIDAARVDRLVDETMPRVETKPFDISGCYAELFRRLDGDPAGRRLGLMSEFAESVKDIESLRAYLKELFVGEMLFPQPFAKAIKQHKAVIERISWFLSPFGVRREEVEKLAAAAAGPHGTEPETLRRFALERIATLYDKRLRVVGKQALYRWENDTLRKAIDEHFKRFLDDFDAHAAGGIHFHLESTIRETQLELRQASQRLLGTLAQAFVIELGKELQTSESGSSLRQGSPMSEVHRGLLRDGVEPCACNSGNPFRQCCGELLYGGVA